MAFILRNPDPALWAAFKAKAASEGRPLRWVLLELIRLYVAGQIRVGEHPQD